VLIDLGNFTTGLPMAGEVIIGAAAAVPEFST